jgi:predicted metal-dependent hydrolase
VKQYSLQINDQVIAYEVVHRPRVTRRIHLEINDEGGLLVVAPKRMSRRAINRTLQLKAGHVARFLHDARSKQQDLAVFSYSGGEKHLYLGSDIALAIDEQPGKRGIVRMIGDQIQVRVPQLKPGQVRNQLTRWYRQQAEQLFAQRLKHYSSQAPWTGGQVPVMKLRSMKKTWGSCSSSGVITLNPHLVKAPAECVDYVVAHEVCHLREHNHGRAFYALQEHLFPQWRQARELLRSRGHLYLHS